MSGTVSGGKSAAETNKKKYDATYLKKYDMTFYQYNGMLGGRKGRTGGFFANRELAASPARRVAVYHDAPSPRYSY